MQVKAALFDLDGTLLDTLEDLSRATNRVLESRGFQPHDVDVYRYFIGDGLKMPVTRALPKEQPNEAVIDACVAEFRKNYGRNSMVKTKAYVELRVGLDFRDVRNSGSGANSKKRLPISFALSGGYETIDTVTIGCLLI